MAQTKHERVTMAYITQHLLVLQRQTEEDQGEIKGLTIKETSKQYFVYTISQLISIKTFVRLGPSPKPKLELKGLDQSRTLNLRITTTTTTTTTHHKLFYQFQDTDSVENQYII